VQSDQQSSRLLQLSTLSRPGVDINKLQRAENNAARAVLSVDSRSDAMPLLRQLHWQPVRHCIVCIRAQHWTGRSILLAFRHIWTITWLHARCRLSCTFCCPTNAVSTSSDHRLCQEFLRLFCSNILEHLTCRHFTHWQQIRLQITL